MPKRKAKLKASTSNSPVLDEVRRLTPEIAELLEKGHSQASIFRQLKSAGHGVGAGRSSFNNAVRQLRPQIDELRARMRGYDSPSLSNSQAGSEVDNGTEASRPAIPSQSNEEAGDASSEYGAKAESVAAEFEAKRPLLLLCANDAGGQFSTTLARVFDALCRLGSATPVLIDANPGQGQLSDYHPNASKVPAHLASVHVPRIVTRFGGRDVIIDVGCNPLWLGSNGSGGLAALVEGFASAGYDCFCYLSVTPSKPGDLTKLAEIVGRFPRAKPFIVLNEWFRVNGMDPADPGYPDKAKYPYPTIELDWLGTVNFRRIEKSPKRSLLIATTDRGVVGDFTQTALIDWLRDFAGKVPHHASFTAALNRLDQLDASIPRPSPFDRT